MDHLEEYALEHLDQEVAKALGKPHPERSSEISEQEDGSVPAQEGVQDNNAAARVADQPECMDLPTVCEDEYDTDDYEGTV